jgi:hypothetical protein
MIGWRGTTETALREGASWWRLLRFLRITAVVGSLVLAAVLLLGLAAVARWITAPGLFIGGVAMVLLVAGLAWIGLGILCAVDPEDRTRIASALERKCPSLLDRLNTLVFLRSSARRSAHPYAGAIEQQARQVLARRPHGKAPFSIRPLLIQCAVLAGMIVATVFFFHRFHPLDRLRQQAHSAEGTAQDPAATALEIPPAQEPAAAPKEEGPWGEIRITRPGSDLRATPLDVVPLRIEAASNRPIQKIEWLTSINGGSETPHALPAPKDSRFASYAPDLDLASLGAKEWDVVAYHARATAGDGTAYRSETYFVELTPFREELQRTAAGQPAGEENSVDQLTAMIQRQEEVIRQTPQRDPRESAADRKARTGQLAREEAELAKQAQRLSAEAAAGEDPEGTKELTRSLQRAQSALDKAEQSLRQDGAEEALKHENAALAALAAARKQAHDDLARNLPSPGKPGEPASPSGAEEAASLQSALDRQIAELRKIEQAPERAERPQLEKTAGQTKDLLARLEKHAQQEPEEEKPTGLRKKLTPENRRELESNCDKLSQSPDADGRRSAAGAVRRGLQELSKAMQDDTARQQAEAAQERNRRALERLEKREQDLESARKDLSELVEEQRKLQRESANQAASKAKPSSSRLAQRQQAQQERLREFQENHKESLSNCQGECSSAQSAMGQAAKAMQAGNRAAAPLAGKAADELQKVDDALRDQSARNRLTEAGELRRALGNEIEQLRQGQQPGSSSEGLQEAAAQSKSTTEGLKRLAEDKALEGQLGRGLRESLADKKKEQLDAQADGVARAASPEGRRQAAGPLQKGLEEVARAFDAGPQGRRPGKQSGPPLVPQGQQAIDQGLRQLQGLNQRRAAGKPLPREGEAKVGREAMAHLRSGMDSVYGYNERGKDVLDKVEKDLKQRERPVDVKLVQALLREIAARQREAAPSGQKPEEEAKKTHIDPSRMPPAYRKSIETYFQKLSEEP